MKGMKIGDREYRALLHHYNSLAGKFPPDAGLAEMNARLEAAELADSRVCRIADVVDDYAEAVARGDMSGAELL